MRVRLTNKIKEPCNMTCVGYTHMPGKNHKIIGQYFYQLEHCNIYMSYLVLSQNPWLCFDLNGQINIAIFEEYMQPIWFQMEASPRLILTTHLRSLNTRFKGAGCLSLRSTHIYAHQMKSKIVKNTIKKIKFVFFINISVCESHVPTMLRGQNTHICHVLGRINTVL